MFYLGSGKINVIKHKFVEHENCYSAVECKDTNNNTEYKNFVHDYSLLSHEK